MSTGSVPIKEFSSYFTESMQQQLPDLEPRAQRLRVSGFPFCGLRTAYLKMIQHVEPDDASYKDFYTSVGTVAHSVFQRWAGANGSIYGDWECRNKECGHKVHFSCKNICPKCGQEMMYEEFTVKAFDNTSGHLDGVWRARLQKKRKSFWVIDYKTSSVRAIEGQKTERTFPYSKNVAQIEAYVPMIEQEINIEVDGWLLIYIARDNPRLFKVVGHRMTDDEKQRVMVKVQLYDKQYGVVQRLKRQKQLDYLVRTKFCKNHEHYVVDMKGFNPCKLAPVCFGSMLGDTLELAFAEYLSIL